MKLSKLPAHLFAEYAMRRHFPASLLDRLQQAVADGETRHDGQVCFAIEGAQTVRALLHGTTPRQRAEEVFAHLRVWDTRNNSGVLIYVLLAERAIEIVADRGIAERVGQGEWQIVCDRMRDRFANEAYEQGAIEGVNAVSDILAAHFPPGDGKRSNELSDEPFIL